MQYNGSASLIGSLHTKFFVHPISRLLLLHLTTDIHDGIFLNIVIKQVH